MKKNELASESRVAAPQSAGFVWQANGLAAPERPMREASWIDALVALFRALRSRKVSTQPQRPTDPPEPSAVGQVDGSPMPEEHLPRLAQTAETLEIEWARGYQEGYGELDAAIGPVPRMPIISIPSQADGLAHVYLVGWEAGIRSAAAALGA